LGDDGCGDFGADAGDVVGVGDLDAGDEVGADDVVVDDQGLDIAVGGLDFHLVHGDVGGAAALGIEDDEEHDGEADEEDPAEESAPEAHSPVGGAGVGPPVLSRSSLGTLFRHVNPLGVGRRRSPPPYVSLSFNRGAECSPRYNDNVRAEDDKGKALRISTGLSV
jgi:hypothetical protein